MTAPDHYRAIVDAAADRDLTRAEIIDVPITAGYSRNSAIGRMSTSHPLFHRVGPDPYRVISPAAKPAGPTDVIIQRVGPSGADQASHGGPQTEPRGTRRAP